MDRKETLEKAYECVAGKREQDYGRPENSLGKIAALWTAYYGAPFSPVDVAMMMGLLKIARIKGVHATEDSFVDLAGYAAIGCEVATEGKAAEVPQEAPQAEPEAPKAEPKPEKKRGGVRNKKEFDEAEFYALLDAGKTNDEIAAHFKTSKTWVSYTKTKLLEKRAKQQGRQAAKLDPPPESLDAGRLAALYNAGWPVEKIADELGVSYDTAYEALKMLLDGRLTVEEAPEETEGTA